MIKRAVLLLICAASVTSVLSAQPKLMVRGKVTYNHFSADDLKTIQEQLAGQLRSIGIPVSVVESFPPYYGMQFQVLFPVKDSAKLNMGFYYEQFSTGGRLHYKDYSGEVGIDQILKANVAGLLLEKILEPKHNVSFSLNIGLSLIWASLDMKTFERIYDQRDESTEVLKNFTLGLLPGFSLSYNLFNVVFSGGVSYQICLPSAFDYNGEIVKNQNGDPYRPGMQGIRFSLGLGYNF
ncbi:MAG: hypothetical protein ACM3Q2_19140 [Syntrophothermus sp.]